MQAVDIGHGRGWLAPAAAASLRRIDQQLGRPADINDAGRSAAQADANHAAWIAYQNGTGPKAPFALPARQSVHVQGNATDSDDWYDPAAAAVWRANGWRQTARYPSNPAKDEPWHAEYFPDLDEHLHDPAPAGHTTTPRRRHTMATLYRSSTKPTRWALAGDSPRTDANWLETQDAGLATAWANTHGDSIKLDPNTWDTFKTRYTTPAQIPEDIA